MLEQWYWVMPNVVLFNNELTDKQKLLYCLISSLCAEKWYCRATNEHLWELLNASKFTISKNVAVLVEKWFIFLEVNQNYQRKLTLVKNDNGDSQKWQGGDSQKWQDNITIENNTIENKENKKEKFLEFVYLTEEEYKKLTDSYGVKVIDNEITNLNNYIWQNWKDKYKSHYHTILNRLRRAGIKEIQKPKQLSKYEIEEWVYDIDKLI